MLLDVKISFSSAIFVDNLTKERFLSSKSELGPPGNVLPFEFLIRIEHLTLYVGVVYLFIKNAMAKKTTKDKTYKYQFFITKYIMGLKLYLELILDVRESS
jgi:hypothetical protein